jgi:protein subunit release factor B
LDLNERFDVSEGKVSQLKERIARLGIDLRLVQEDFTRGGGKGGQKINKTSNCVRLDYPPLGLSVRVQRERKRTVNRFLALRELVNQIEMKLSPETSERLAEWDKIRKRKARRRERAAKP